MTRKEYFTLMASDAIEQWLSERLEAIRLSRNMTQNQLAEEAGVSRSTLTRMMQDGKGISLDSFIRIMMALKLTGSLQAMLPDPSIQPLQQLERSGKRRQRARPKTDEVPDEWRWGDDGDEQ